MNPDIIGSQCSGLEQSAELWCSIFEVSTGMSFVAQF